MWPRAARRNLGNPRGRRRVRTRCMRRPQPRRRRGWPQWRAICWSLRNRAGCSWRNSVTLVPASQARRICPSFLLDQPAPHSVRADASADGDGVRRLVPGLGHVPGHGEPGVGIDTGTGHRASRYTRPASSRSVRSCGSRRTRRGLEAISPGCTSCPSASFIARSSPRPRRPHLPSPVSRGSRPGRRGAGHGAEHHVPFRPFLYRTDRMRRTGRSIRPSSGPRRTRHRRCSRNCA